VSQTRPPDAPTPPDLGRRTLSRFGYAVCIVVPFLIAAIGFTFLHFHYDKEDLVRGTRLPLLTSDWRPGDQAMTDQVSGELTLEDGCVSLVGPDGARVDLVWPADFEATVQHVGSSDQLKVYDTDRHIAARGGDRVELEGGSASTDAYAGRPCAPVSDEVFLVQSEVTVTGRE
jgi:hypothetical protein